MKTASSLLRIGGMVIAVAFVAISALELFWKTTLQIPDHAVLSAGKGIDAATQEGEAFAIPTTRAVFDTETHVILGDAQIGGWISRHPGSRFYVFSPGYPNVPYWCMGGLGLCLLGIIVVSAKAKRPGQGSQ